MMDSPISSDSNPNSSSAGASGEGKAARPHRSKTTSSGDSAISIDTAPHAPPSETSLHALQTASSLPWDLFATQKNTTADNKSGFQVDTLDSGGHTGWARAVHLSSHEREQPVSLPLSDQLSYDAIEPAPAAMAATATYKSFSPFDYSSWPGEDVLGMPGGAFSMPVQEQRAAMSSAQYASLPPRPPQSVTAVAQLAQDLHHGAAGGKPGQGFAAASFGSSAFKAGDWVCVSPSCSFHNYSRNSYCVACGSRKPTSPTTRGNVSLPPSPPTVNVPHPPQPSMHVARSEVPSFFPLPDGGAGGAVGVNAGPSGSPSGNTGTIPSSGSYGIPHGFAPVGPRSVVDEFKAAYDAHMASVYGHANFSVEGLRSSTSPLMQSSQPPTSFVKAPPLLPALATRSDQSSSRAPTSTAALSTAAKLASLGVSMGAGINPVAKKNDPRTDSQDNPPIVNTGNSGPMCVQPGDWICTDCGFINWRRRKVCMRCYPFVEGNEVAASLAEGAMLAAQIAAGATPSPAALEALANSRDRRPTDATKRAASFGSSGLSMGASAHMGSAAPMGTAQRGIPHDVRVASIAGPRRPDAYYQEPVPSTFSPPPFSRAPSINDITHLLHNYHMSTTRASTGSPSTSSVSVSHASTAASSPASFGPTLPAACPDDTRRSATRDIWGAAPVQVRGSSMEDEEVRPSQTPYKPKPIGTRERDSSPREHTAMP